MSEAIPEGSIEEEGDNLKPPLSCLAIKNTIREAMIWIKNTEYFTEEGDEGHEEQYEGLSEALTSAREAFDCKPDGCKMQCSSNDNFYCEDCDFEADMDPLQ